MKITDSEWEVMRVIWVNEPVTSRTVTDILAVKREWKSATVKTLLGRLQEKGAITATAKGNKFLYYSAVSEKDALLEANQQLMEHICAREKGDAYKNLLIHTELSKKDIDSLVSLLNTKRESAPEKLTCSCTPGQCQCQHTEGGAKHYEQNLRY